MGITFPLLFVTVLICSSAVASTISNDVEEEVDAIVLQPDQLSCSTCNLLSLIMKEKFESIKREDMAERMLHSCYSLQVLSETCANIVADYFDDIYDLVKEQLQSNDICAVSGICSDGDWKMESEELKTERKHDEFYCVECKKIVKHVHESLIKNLTEAQFKKMLMGSCALTRSLKTECLRVVDQYSHIIYSMLKSNFDTEGVCLLIGVCDKKTDKVQQYLDSDVDSAMPQCLLCKTAFRIAKKIISKHASNDQVKHAMNRACDKLGKVSQKCHDFVNRHGNGIIRFVRNPRVICSMLGMCFPIGQEAMEYKIGELTKDEDMQLITDALTKDSKNCYFCKLIIERLQKMVKDHHDINKALKSVCHMLMDKNQRDKCQNMIDKHTDLIVDLVSKNVAHQQICRSLNMCLLLEQENLRKSDNDKFELEMPQPVIEEDTKGVPKCSICQTAMRALKQMIHHGGKDEIKRALGHVCQKHTPPKMICKMIGMCHTSDSQEDFEMNESLSEEENTQISVDVEVTASPKCFLCKKMMSAMQHMAQHHGDRGSIQRAMQRVCSKLGKLSRRCDRMVQRYGNQIVDLMVKHVGAQRICNMIGVCKKSTFLEHFEEEFSDSKTVNFVNEFWEVFVIDEIVPSDQPEGSTDPQEGPLCIICELLIARFKATVDTKGKRDEILKSILHTCDRLPSFIREPCHSIVQGYGYAVLGLISRIPPHEVCHILQTSAYETNSDDLGFLQDLDEFLQTN
ncbi:hypothetical protein ACLKA7_013610 [Drosophila subpalustris]